MSLVRVISHTETNTCDDTTNTTHHRYKMCQESNRIESYETTRGKGLAVESESESTEYVSVN